MKSASNHVDPQPAMAVSKNRVPKNPIIVRVISLTAISCSKPPTFVDTRFMVYAEITIHLLLAKLPFIININSIAIDSKCCHYINYSSSTTSTHPNPPLKSVTFAMCFRPPPAPADLRNAGARASAPRTGAAAGSRCRHRFWEGAAVRSYIYTYSMHEGTCVYTYT